jgi:hypothetical protein
VTNERINEIARRTRSYLESGMRAGWNPLYVETLIAETLTQARAEAAGPHDPIAAAVDAQLDPLKDELKAIGHKLEEQTRER